jgi:Coenzyme PQQ synthesis protein D (PqqD)
MDLTNRFPTPHSQVAGRVIDGEAVLVLADSGQVQVLNEVGARVWELADGTRSLAQIVDEVVSEFDVGAEQAAADVLAFVERLVAERIVIVQDHPGTPV